MDPRVEVVVLACTQALPESGVFLTLFKGFPLEVRVVREPCSSKVEVFQMLCILASDADLLWVVGCPEDRCQMFEGSRRLGRRVAYARQYLQEIGLEPERVGLIRLTPGEEGDLALAVGEIKARVLALGPNPGRSRPLATMEDL